MAHVTTLLESFKTGTKGTVNCLLLGTAGPDGKPIEYKREGDNYVVGIGDGVVRLMELIALRKRRNAFWYRFFNGSFDLVELDIAIKRLQGTLNLVSAG